MLNVNVSDKFFEAVEDYNRTATNIEKKETFAKMSNDEKKGVFYNALRRQFPFLNSNLSYRLQVEDLRCQFRENNEIQSVVITREFRLGHSWEIDTDKVETMSMLKRIASLYKTIYPTRILNEMSLIVNSL